MAGQSVTAVVDERIKQLSDSLELRLTKELERTLAERAEANRKLFTWAVGSVTLVLALLGIKTFSDMRTVARAAATEEVKQRLSLDDPNSEIRRDIDKMLAKALIDSYMFKMAKADDEDGFRPEIDISDRDAERIGRFILDPATKADDFNDGLQLLMQTENDGGERPYVEEVKKLLAEPKSWIFRQPAKLKTVLELTSDDSLQSYARTVLQDNGAKKELLAAAIGYSVRTNDQQAIALLEKLAAFPEKEIAVEALAGLGSISPVSATLRTALLAPLDPEDTSAVRNRLQMAGGLAKPAAHEFFMSDPHEKLRVQLLARAFQQAIAAGYVFRMMDSSFRSRRSTASTPGISKRDRLGFTMGVGPDLFGPNGLKAASLVLQQSSASMGQFQKAFTAFCMVGRGNSCRRNLKISLGPGASILVAGRPALDSAAATSGVTIDTSESDGQLIATWKDRGGLEQSAPLAGIRNASAASFSLATKNTSGNDD
jgi:hypothetical protein